MLFIDVIKVTLQKLESQIFYIDVNQYENSLFFFHIINLSLADELLDHILNLLLLDPFFLIKWLNLHFN